MAIEYYIKRARYSDVIYLTSLLETYLTEACDRLRTYIGDHNLIFAIGELAGDKWTKRKKFVERYGKFSFPAEAWSTIEHLISIRNLLVHENGRLEPNPDPKKTESKKAELSKSPGLTIDGHELVIEGGYVAHCLSAVRSLVGYVDGQLDKMVDRALCPHDIQAPGANPI